MGVVHAKRLLVEGKDDAYAIASLMSHFVAWGDTERQWPVLLEPAGSAQELLAEEVVPTYLSEPGTKILGVLIDANESFEQRWQRIRQVCLPAYPGLPEQCPAQGLIQHEGRLPRFGVWIMPDNRSRGMLESFLKLLVPTEPQELWAHAQAATRRAKQLGAPYKDAHCDKADIHTWLAWQDQPGKPLGEALKSKCLDPRSACATAFVEWFIRLFDLESLRLPAQ